MPIRSQTRNVPVLDSTARLFLVVVAIASIFLLTPRVYEQRTSAQTQANCDTSSCPQLTTESNVKLSGPITYSFDEAALSQFLGGDATKIADFKKHFKDAADDWATQTGVSISPAAAGSSGNLTVTMSDSATARNDNGFTAKSGDHGTLTISDEYWGWSNAGKDRLFSHEFGHFLGLGDVKPWECPGTLTVMRQLGELSDLNAVVADSQLINGYTCNGNPSCPDRVKLPTPPRPTPCDAAKAKAIHDHNPADDEGGGNPGGGNDPCYGSDTSCEPYYDPNDYFYYDNYDLPNGYVTIWITDVSVDIYECPDCGDYYDYYDDPWDDGGGCYDYSSYGSCI